MRSREVEHGWLCITEAAKYAQVAEKDINAAIASGDLPAFNHPASDPSARRRNIRIGLATPIWTIPGGTAPPP